MRRLASHYIWYKKVYRLHYLEIDDEGCFQGIYPLKEEIAGTQFYNGILIPLPLPAPTQKDSILKEWKSLTGQVDTGTPVHIYHLNETDANPSSLLE